MDHTKLTGAGILKALLSGDEDEIRKVLSADAIIVNIQGPSNLATTQSPPPSGQAGNFLIQHSEPAGTATFTYFGHPSDRDGLKLSGAEKSDVTPQFRAGLILEKKVPYPDDPSKATKYKVRDLLYAFERPNSGEPFLLLTEVMDCSTLCFTVALNGALHIGVFVPCDEQTVTMTRPNKGKDLSRLLKKKGVTDTGTQLHILGPDDFRRSKKDQKKHGGEKQHDKCAIIVLWDGEGWHIYAQFLRPRKHSQNPAHDLEPVAVIELYSWKTGTNNLLWHKG